MKIDNVRFGFACNSSSTHSLVFNFPGIEEKTDYKGLEYGWNEWVVRSLETKTQYLASQLYHSIRRDVGDEAALAIAKQWSSDIAGVQIEDPEGEDNWGYIDHQSLFRVPLDFQGKGPSKQFFADMIEHWAKNPDVAIMGGNDNSMESSVPEEYKTYFDSYRGEIGLPVDTKSNWRARKDGQHWILFHDATGIKIRFSFEDDPEPYLKSEVPELVDIKITDFCPYGCDFCYQGSTMEGRHAKYHGRSAYSTGYGERTLRNLPYHFGQMGVFEVALGGGETTLHPEIVDIIRAFHQNNVTPNITTFNDKWHRNEDLREAIIECCGGIAFSASSGQGVEKFTDSIKMSGISAERCSFQVIPGVVGSYTFERIVAEIQDSFPTYKKPTLTLLGYKETGRGERFDKKDCDWFEILTEAEGHLPPISIDTALANEYPERTQELAQGSKLITRREGAHSMYIDAVDGRYGPSSYHEDKLRDLPEERWNIDELFAGIEPV